jgi:tetratricopeptide (TPR) repeat protein
MRNIVAISATSLLVLTACGGQAEAGRRPESAPTFAVLASPAGPGATDLRAGRPEAARARLEAMLAADPERLGPLNDLAVGFAVEGRGDAARALLDDVVAHGDAREQQLALVNLGAIHAADGYLVAAQAHFDTARSMDPSRPEPAYALALLADVRGQRVRAAELAREALGLDDGGAARAGLAFLFPEERAHLEALVAEARGDREAALSRWRELRAGRFPALAAAAQRRLDE